MITGSCLCGGVRFEIVKAAGPFELCHCNRCRKTSGSAFGAGIGVKAEDFRLVAGKELITNYEAPILRNPPPYRISFCTRCGSQVPNPERGAKWFEVPAGLLDDDPVLRPDKHIFVHVKARWFEIADRLPQYNLEQLTEIRSRAPKPFAPND
ncbi:MAG: GFA family protein [Pseudomonadota bacterium]